LCDFEALKECFHIRVRALRADAAFSGVKQVEEGGGLFREGTRGIWTIGERVRAEVQGTRLKRGKIASGNHGHRRFRKQEAPTAESAERGHFRPNPQNREREARQGDTAIEVAEQPWSTEGRSQLAGAIEYAANHIGIGMVRNGEAYRAALEGDTLNLKAAVVVNGGSELLEVCGQARGIDLADEDF